MGGDLTLALKHLDGDTGLVVLVGGVAVAGLAGDTGVLLDDPGEDAAHDLRTQGEMRVELGGPPLARSLSARAYI